MGYETVLLLSITSGNRRNVSFEQYGSTNDIDSVDGTLFQSGRIDTPIEVGLRDDQRRLQIFNIYTKALLGNGTLQTDIDINCIISNSERFTGANIEHVVRLTLHNAMCFDIVDKGRIDIRYEEADQLQICKQDLMLALGKVREKHISLEKTVTMINKLKQITLVTHNILNKTSKKAELFDFGDIFNIFELIRIA